MNEAEKPKKRIESTDIFDFFDMVEDLPEKPIGDECQLVKEKIGKRWRPKCVGKCKGGHDCRLKTGIIKNMVFAECLCE